MKTLMIMRHGKSLPATPEINDHDRPLAEEGRNNALRLGEELKTKGVMPDLILSSSALRCRETMNALTLGWEHPHDRKTAEELYETSLVQQINFLSTVESKYSSVLVIGHNPSCEEWLANLTRQVQSVAPGTFAVLAVMIEEWCELDLTTSAKLTQFWRPQDKNDGLIY